MKKMTGRTKKGGMVNNIVTEHEGYTKITYPWKRRAMAHMVWNPEGAADNYLWNNPPDFKVVFGEDMTVEDIGYGPLDAMMRSDEKGRFEVLIFCPECMGIAQKATDGNFIDRLYYDDDFPEEVICRECGRTFTINPSDGSITCGRYALKDPVKENTRRWLSAMLFSEENADMKGCVSVALNYAVSGINGTSYKTFNKPGAVRITMNMETGMIYMINKKVRGKYPEKDMRVIKGGDILNITYGSEYLSRKYCGDMGICINGETVADKLNDPDVVRFFAEALIRYGKARKKDLTKTGDFSDTNFWRLCALNCIPEAAEYADILEEMMWFVGRHGDWYAGSFRAVRRCLKDIRKTFRKGREYTASRYMNRKIPKSIRKMIAKDPTDYYVYKTLRKVGFRNTDQIRMIMKDTDMIDKISVLSIKEDDYVKYGDRKHAFVFIKDMIARFGEKKAARIVKSTLEYGENFCIFSDAIEMYSEIAPENRVLKGKNITEIHDALLLEYRKMNKEKMNGENMRFSYTQDEKDLEGIVNNTAFFLPEDRSELFDAADHLHNCVSAYYSSIMSKSSTIVLMKKGKKLVGCIEVRENKVVQAYAPCNLIFPEEDHNTFEEWRLSHGLKGHANGWK